MNMFENYGTYGFNPLFNNNQQNGLNFNSMPQQPKANGNYFYVNGIEGAKSFFISQPNTTVILFDSDSSDFFVKATNQQGQAILRRFEYKEKTLNEAKTQALEQQTINPDDFVSKKEFNDFKSLFKTLQQPKTENKGGAVKND